MQKQVIDQWGEFTRTALDSLKELGQINTKLVTRLSQQQLELLNTSLEAAGRETQLVGESKGYNDLVAHQSALAAEYNRKFLDIVRTTTNVLEETRNELTAWVEKGVKSVERATRDVAKTVESTASRGSAKVAV
jgi:hypothetical protein